MTTAKVYPTPPSIDKLVELFQDFYLQAESHISTHVQALASKQYRDASPAPSVSSRTSTSGKMLAPLGSRSSGDSLSKLSKPTTGQQMLTPSEISERRRARRVLELKRLALEEKVERRVCERIYSRIWRHKSSLDEVKDEKLRSKTAALALVGITLQDLGIDFDEAALAGTTSKDLNCEIQDWISRAREGLLQMNESQHPLGKLQSLASTHQVIVDLLSAFHKSSSSADEILPTLIYTLITCPPEGISIISNLNFIQRFRSTNKINGEAAYCLTNLEAAITFLETVDLATLRSEEAIEADSKMTASTTNNNTSSHSPALVDSTDSALKSRAVTRAASPVTTPLTAVPPRLTPSPSPASVSLAADARASPPASPSQQRRLSSLLQPSANAIGAASDAVRNSADQSFKNISTTLDSSFKLLFGRLKEQQVQGISGNPRDTVVVPKTLDEARRLVSPKPALDEDGNISEASSFTEQEDNARDDRILEMITGKTRDRSVDSASSAGRRLALQTDNKAGSDAISSSPPTGGPLSAVESMRSFGNSLNPLNRLSGINVMRGFGRSAGSSPAITPSPLASNDPNKQLRDPEKGLSGASEEDSRDHRSKFVMSEPPIQRFLDISTSGDLKMSEVEILLRDYQRLAKVVKDMKLC